MTRKKYGTLLGLDARFVGFIVSPIVAGAIFGAIAIGPHWKFMLLTAIYAVPLAVLIGLPVFFLAEQKFHPLSSCLLSGLIAGGILWFFLALWQTPLPSVENWFQFRNYWKHHGIVPLVGGGCGFVGGLVLYGFLALGRSRAKPNGAAR